MKYIRILYFVVLIAIIGTLVYLSKPYFVEYKNAKTVQNEVNKAKNNKTRTVDFNKLQNINKDIIAWLYIKGTKIDYPVVKTRDNKFYLYHNIKKAANSYGSLFFDAREYNNPLKEKNLIIYGHNMGSWTNSMFSNLDDFLSSNYLKKHKRVLLYTNKEVLEYTVAIAKEVYSNDKDSFKIKFNKNEFNEWKRNVIPESDSLELETKQVLTLATCNNSGSKRIVLHCVKN